MKGVKDASPGAGLGALRSGGAWLAWMLAALFPCLIWAGLVLREYGQLAHRLHTLTVRLVAARGEQLTGGSGARWELQLELYTRSLGPALQVRAVDYHLADGSTYLGYYYYHPMASTILPPGKEGTARSARGGPGQGATMGRETGRLVVAWRTEDRGLYGQELGRRWAAGRPIQVQGTLSLQVRLPRGGRSFRIPWQGIVPGPSRSPTEAQERESNDNITGGDE